MARETLPIRDMPPPALEKSGSLETNVTDRTVSVVKPFGI
jgi:hypothetical protein